MLTKTRCQCCQDREFTCILARVSKFGGPAKVTRSTNWYRSGSKDRKRLSILDRDSCATIFGKTKWNLVDLIERMRLCNNDFNGLVQWQRHVL